MWHAYKTLEQSEITQIHEASLQILGKIGIEIDHPLALEKLAEAGARIDKKNKRAYFNSELIEKSLKTVPKSFSIAGRDPQFDLKVSQQNQSPFLKMCGGPILMFDAAANRERKMTIQDNIQTKRRFLESCKFSESSEFSKFSKPSFYNLLKSLDLKFLF